MRGGRSERIARLAWLLAVSITAGLAGEVTAAERATRPACAPARAPSAGRHEIVLGGGEARRYLLHLPPRYDGRTRVPVVVDLHGTGATPELELAISGLDRAADAHGFAVVLPVA